MKLAIASIAVTYCSLIKQNSFSIIKKLTLCCQGRLDNALRTRPCWKQTHIMNESCTIYTRTKFIQQGFFTKWKEGYISAFKAYIIYNFFLRFQCGFIVTLYIQSSKNESYNLVNRPRHFVNVVSMLYYPWCYDISRQFTRFMSQLLSGSER